MAPRGVVVAIVSLADDLKPDLDAVRTRGAGRVLPDDVRDLPTLAARLSSMFTIPDGSTFYILGKLDEEDPFYFWLPFEGALPDAKYLYVKIVLPSADSTNNAVANILQKLDALGAEVSRTRSASGINVEDFERVVKMLRICGPISEDIDGNLVEDEDILEAMLGDERFWDERYEEQQREEYREVVEGWLADKKKNPRIRWVNGNRTSIKHRFEGLNFDLSSKNDVIAVSRSFRELFGLGVEMKRKRMTKKSLRQAMVVFFLWADASVFPFVQLLTDMQRGGVAFYCKAIDARWGIDLRQVILKDMKEVKAFVSRIGASFPDDLGDDTPNGLIIPETFDDPPRKKFKPLEKPDEGSLSKADEGSFSRQQTGAKRATKAQIALWTIGCRLLENEGDVANLADVMDLDSFQQQDLVPIGREEAESYETGPHHSGGEFQDWPSR